jgi:hypothetical protein
VVHAFLHSWFRCGTPPGPESLREYHGVLRWSERTDWIDGLFARLLLVADADVTWEVFLNFVYPERGHEPWRSRYLQLVMNPAARQLPSGLVSAIPTDVSPSEADVLAASVRSVVVGTSADGRSREGAALAWMFLRPGEPEPVLSYLRDVAPGLRCPFLREGLARYGVPAMKAIVSAVSDGLCGPDALAVVLEVHAQRIPLDAPFVGELRQLLATDLQRWKDDAAASHVRAAALYLMGE